MVGGEQGEQGKLQKREGILFGLQRIWRNLSQDKAEIAAVSAGGWVCSVMICYGPIFPWSSLLTCREDKKTALASLPGSLGMLRDVPKAEMFETYKVLYKSSPNPQPPVQASTVNREGENKHVFQVDEFF